MRFSLRSLAPALSIAGLLAAGCAPSEFVDETSDTGDTGGSSDSSSEGNEEADSSGDGDSGDGDGTSAGDGDGTSGDGDGTSGDGDGTSGDGDGTSGDGDGTSGGDGDGTSGGDGDGTSGGDGDGTSGGDGDGDGTGCVQGELGCDCFGNQTCFQPLLCDSTSNICTSPQCNDGELGCPCFPNQTCFQGLVCGTGDICVTGDGDGDGDGDGTSGDGDGDGTSGDGDGDGTSGDGDGTCVMTGDLCDSNGQCCSGFCYSDFGGGGVTPPECQDSCIDPGAFIACDDDGDCCGDAFCDMSGFFPQCAGDGDGDGDVGDGLTCGSAYELSVGTTPVARDHTTVGGGSHNNNLCNNAGNSPDRTYDIEITAAGSLEVTVVPTGGWDPQVHALADCLDAGSGLECVDDNGGGGTENMVIPGVNPNDIISVVVDGFDGDEGDYTVTFQVF